MWKACTPDRVRTERAVMNADEALDLFFELDDSDVDSVGYASSFELSKSYRFRVIKVLSNDTQCMHRV